jgi:hypothetical protein
MCTVHIIPSWSDIENRRRSDSYRGRMLAYKTRVAMKLHQAIGCTSKYRPVVSGLYYFDLHKCQTVPAWSVDCVCVRACACDQAILKPIHLHETHTIPGKCNVSDSASKSASKTLVYRCADSARNACREAGKCWIVCMQLLIARWALCWRIWIDKMTTNRHCSRLMTLTNLHQRFNGGRIYFDGFFVASCRLHGRQMHGRLYEMLIQTRFWRNDIIIHTRKNIWCFAPEYKTQGIQIQTTSAKDASLEHL